MQALQTMHKVAVRGVLDVDLRPLNFSSALSSKYLKMKVENELTKTKEAAMRLHMGEEAASISIKYAALYVVGSYLICCVTRRSLQLMPSKRWTSITTKVLSYNANPKVMNSLGWDKASVV